MSKEDWIRAFERAAVRIRDEAEVPAAEKGHCLTCGRNVYRPDGHDVAECWHCKNPRLQLEDPGPELERDEWMDEEDPDADPQG
jgi:5-methylcytosine-specific restriction endonuclease McrA